MNNELLTISGASLSIEGKFVIGRNFLKVAEDATDEDLKEIFKYLETCNGGLLFFIGDFLNEVELRKGQAYAKSYSMTSYAPSTLYNAKNLCRYFPRELRTNLSFTHHYTALGECRGDVEMARGFLLEAEKEGLSFRELRTLIREKIRDANPEPEEPETEANKQLLQLMDSFNIIADCLRNLNAGTPILIRNYLSEELMKLNTLAGRFLS